MPEIMSEQKDPAMPTEETDNSSLRPRTGFFSTAHSSEGMLTDPISTGSVVDDPTRVTEQKDSELPWLRINWEIKALVPIACVLLGGMLLFLLATLSWRDPERHMVLLVAGAGAVAICGVLLVVLTYTVQRPMGSVAAVKQTAWQR